MRDFIGALLFLLAVTFASLELQALGLSDIAANFTVLLAVLALCIAFSDRLCAAPVTS